MRLPWTQPSTPPHIVFFRWNSVVDHINHAAPTAPRRWTMARPRKGTTRSRGRCGSGCPRGEEYEGSLVWLCCRGGLTAPYYSHRWPGHPSTPLTHTPCYSAATAARPNQLTLVLLSAWASTAASSPAPCCPLPRPRRRPLPWCYRRGVVNVVNDRIPSKEYCTWRG